MGTIIMSPTMSTKAVTNITANGVVTATAGTLTWAAGAGNITMTNAVNDFGTVAVTSAAFFLVVIGMALQARRRPVVTGSEELIGSQGEIIEHADGQWWARVHGEMWKVRSQAHLHRGQRVRVTRIDGLVLEVGSDDT